MQQTQEWGEFFPAKLSPWAYNTTVAQEYFPLTEAAARKLGHTWHKSTNTSPEVNQNLSLADSLSDISDEILNQTLLCEQTGKAYKIIAQELLFYKNMQIPIPRLCPDARHLQRLHMRNPRKLYKRKCDLTNKEIVSTYSSDRIEKVYSEQAYFNYIK